MSLPAASVLSEADLTAIVADAGAPKWRARQVRTAIWQPFVQNLDQVAQLPGALREGLAERMQFTTVTVAAQSDADSGKTVKLLCRLADGQTVETVAMETPASDRSRRRATVCVSTQVGCAVGCPFCATGQMGLRRNCEPAEIVDQVRAAAFALHERGLGPVTHIVYMGMGEPLTAYESTVASLRVLTTAGGISPRRITVSTSGVIPAIDRLVKEQLPVTLAISLHAATNELRNRLVPINKKYPLQELVAAGTRYASETGRRLTFEWCLIGGVNDSDEQANGLRIIAREAKAHVNVIPMNHIDGSPWGPPPQRQRARFLSLLKGAPMTVRDTRGATTDAACGQLRAGLEKRRSLLPDGTLSRPRGKNA